MFDLLKYYENCYKYENYKLCNCFFLSNDINQDLDNSFNLNEKNEFNNIDIGNFINEGNYDVIKSKFIPSFNEETKNTSLQNSIHQIKLDFENINSITINNSIIEEKSNDEFLLLYTNIKKELKDFLNDKISSETELSLGRKRKNSSKIGKHNKYTDDNLIRKIKQILIDYIYNFINSLLKKVYDKKNKKQLLKINQKQAINNKVNYNIKFLDKSLKDIFSDNLSTKYQKYSFDYNKTLIQNLLNEEDIEKKILFEKVFNLTFFDCLKHFRNEKYIKELNGLTLLEDTYKKFENQNDFEMYKKIFEFYAKNFERIIKIKKERKRNSSIIVN